MVGWLFLAGLKHFIFKFCGSIDDVVWCPIVDCEMATLSADLNAVPETVLLDVSANKTKGQLSNTGSIAARRRPSKQSSSPVNSMVKSFSWCLVSISD